MQRLIRLKFKYVLERERRILQEKESGMKAAWSHPPFLHSKHSMSNTVYSKTFRPAVSFMVPGYVMFSEVRYIIYLNKTYNPVF